VSSTINVLGGFTNGSELAARVAEDVKKASSCSVMTGRGVMRVHATSGEVEVALDNNDTYTTHYVIVATGVGSQDAADVNWLEVRNNIPLKALWEASATDLHDKELIILGIDRPLGTVLRTYPGLKTQLKVIYSTNEAYKADEVRADPRITLIPARHAVLTEHNGFLCAHVTSEDGGTAIDVTGTQAFLNLGSRPVKPAGNIASDQTGYCPPERQPDRILIAGDLRSARYQRIMTAFGSGAEAALKAYYELKNVH
jgi:thioredoxin reductase (NADPH)/alkyl hydroperoxide reductase subunit F